MVRIPATQADPLRAGDIFVDPTVNRMARPPTFRSRCRKTINKNPSPAFEPSHCVMCVAPGSAVPAGDLCLVRMKLLDLETHLLHLAFEPQLKFLHVGL